MPGKKYRKLCSKKVCVAFFALLPSFMVEAFPNLPTSVLSPGEFLAAPNRPTFHGNASTFFRSAFVSRYQVTLWIRMFLTLLGQHYSVAVEKADSFSKKLGCCFNFINEQNDSYSPYRGALWIVRSPDRILV
jgi:hypothetical protein